MVQDSDIAALLENLNYEKLRHILEIELEREVTLEEAVNTGNHLLNVYEILLYNRGDYDTISVDTTNQTK